MTCLRAAAILLGWLVTLAGAAWAEPPQDKPNQRTDRYGDPLPEGVISRLGTTRFRHGDEIEDLVFSPKGDVLASVCHHQQSIRLWDACTGKQLWEVSDVAAAQPGCVVFSPDGRDVAICETGGTIRIHTTVSGRVTNRLSAPGIPYSHPTYSPDGRILAFVAGNAAFVVWDLLAMKEIAHFKARASSEFMTWRLTLTGDGKLLACGGGGTGQWRYWVLERIYTWQVRSGKTLAEGEGPAARSKFAAFSCTGEELFYGGKGSLEVWQTTPPKSLRAVRQKERGFLSFALSPDGKTLASASWGGIIQLWDAATLKEVKKFDGAGSRVTALALSPDAKVLASAESGIIRLWDTTTGKRCDAFQGQEEGITGVAFGKQGETILSVGRDAVRVWDVATAALRHQQGENGTLGGPIAVSPDEKLLACGHEAVSLWDLATGKRVQRVPTGARWIDALGWLDDKKLVLVGGNVIDQSDSERWIAVWDAGEQKETRRLGLGKEPVWGHHTAFRAFSPDGQFLVSSQFAIGSSSGPVPPTFLWRTTKGKRLHQIGGKDTGGGRAVAFSPDGRMLATPDWWTAPIQVWEVATGKERRRLPASDEARVDSIAFSPDGRLLVAGDCYGRIHVWDLANGKEVKTLAGHDGAISCLAFTEDGKLMASGSEDTTVLVWDLADIAKDSLSAPPRSEKKVSALWEALADAEAGKAYRAMWGLAAAPEEAIPLLRKQLRPIASNDAATRKLIGELGSEQFAVRKRATEELRGLGELARPALEELLKSRPDPETRRRAEQLLNEDLPVRSPDQLRSLRAVEALERIGTPEARDALRALASGAPKSHLMREAEAALERLGKRVK